MCSWNPVTDSRASHEITGNWLLLSFPKMVEFGDPHSGDVTSSDGSHRFVRSRLVEAMIDRFFPDARQPLLSTTANSGNRCCLRVILNRNRPK